jgi:hypothetical protein
MHGQAFEKWLESSCTISEGGHMKYVITHIDRSENETLEAAETALVRVSLRSDSGVIHLTMPKAAPILKDWKIGDECEIELLGDLRPIPLH